MNTLNKKGFTLLELLIVITIIAVLSTIAILVLNPVETLKKSRDSQRFSDLATIKTALGLYSTDQTSPDLDAGVASGCLAAANTSAKIFYSSPGTEAGTACAAVLTNGGDVTTGSTFASLDTCYNVASPNASIDGTGWLPANLSLITGGSPLSNFPLDPVNTAMTATPTTATFTYRYACQQGTVAAGKPAPVFELDTVLESTAFNANMTTDGGDNTGYYETGTSLKLLPTGTNF